MTGPTIPQGPAFVEAEEAEPEPTEAELTELRYDAAEVRIAMATHFSAGELGKIAQRFKIFTDREGSPGAAAGQLVRAMDGRGRLDDLVRRLRDVKPEVEWPAGVPTAVSPATPTSDVPTHADAPQISSPPSSAAQPLADPYASARPPAAAKKTRPTWFWPALTAGALTMGLATGLLGSALLSDDDDAEQEALERRDQGVAVARLAADELEKSISWLTRQCDVEDDQGTAIPRMTEAFRSCALSELPSRPRDGRPTAVPPPEPTRRPRIRPPGPTTPRRRRSAASGCLDLCHGQHQECIQRDCGNEPAAANDYADYQVCLSSCLSRYSRCRLSCR